MKFLLVITAALESLTGIALLLAPSAVTGLLLGASLDGPAAAVVARVGGAGLLALGTACWFSRNYGTSPAACGLVVAMTLYNVAAVLVLTHAGAALGLAGIMLWPAVILHAAMTAWCVACLRNAPSLR
jgi:hypothetical protein